MPPKISAGLGRKLRSIRMVVLDVDGVMTDGRIIYGSDGTEYKSFHVHDGYGIFRARAAGLKFAIISGRTSRVTTYRARRLGIGEVHQGADDKLKPYRILKARHKLKDREICFIGDDEFDLPLLDVVGFSAAPGDAIAEVKKRVDYVAHASGGRGAVREIVDMILRSRGLL